MLRGMQALVLCGGQGTRLRDIVSDRPKPMASLGGRPFLDVLLSYLHYQGVDKIVLSLGYMASYFRNHYLKAELPFELHMVEETQPQGTAGAIKHCEYAIDSSPFLVCNGDSLCPFDLSKMKTVFARDAPLAVVGLTRLEDTRDYGRVELDESGVRILSFQEKMIAGEGMVNGGVYLFSREIFGLIPAGRSCSLELELFPQLLLQKRELSAHIEKRELWDIGTPARLGRTEYLLKEAGLDFGYAFNDQ